MDPETRQKMVELLELTRENNKILHGLRRSQRWNTILNIIYWLIIIGIAIGAFYFLQPYVEKFDAFRKSIPNITQIQAYFQTIGGK